ncbi:MAG TPA: hypothetical protein VFU76_13790 [Terriglobales bacterium]|nr:hypothetical protein [Terriglobales bacterium]
MTERELQFTPPAAHVARLRALAIVGAAILAAGMYWAPQRAWANLLLAGYYFLGIALAGTLFVAFQYVTGASWSVALRRIPEAFASLVPIGGAAILAVVLFRPSLYAWTADASLTGFRKLWLSLPFFRARALLFLALWTLFSFLLLSASRRQDSDGDFRHTHSNARISGAFLVVFAITFWLASYDWVMSLEPDWWSTIFGMYNFAGLFSSGLAAIAVVLVYLRERTSLRHIINEDHLRDLGKLVFAFSTFWMYLWFSQYMLIWYANIPEETVYYVQRQHGLWAPLFLLNVVLNWVIPFFALMPRVNKGKPGFLLRVSLVLLVGRWLDLYLMIAPPFAGTKPSLGLWELGGAALLVGGFGLAAMAALRRRPLAPTRDPFFVDSLHYHA